MSSRTWAIAGAIVVVVTILGLLVWQQRGAAPEQPTPVALAASPTAALTAAPIPTRPAATPTPAPVAAPPTAQPAPVAPSPLPTLVANVSGPAVVGSAIQIALDAGWLGADQPDPAALGLTDTSAVPLLAAWHGAATFTAADQRLTVIRTPRQEIPLATYAAEVVTSLAQTPQIAVTAHEITTTLRSDGLPVALVSFTQADPQGSGWQAALIDPSGDNLVVVTYVASRPAGASAEAQFRTFVASLVFERPTD